MALDLVTIEHSPNKDVLVEESKEVTFPLSAEIRQLIADMKEKVIAIEGVGLAAPQVGHGVKVIVYTISDEASTLRGSDETVPLTTLINPTYVPLHGEKEKVAYDWEGCFSVAEKTGKVPRYEHIRYSAFDENGQKIQGTAKGFTARVLQHEIDHVHGVLILHRLTKECIQGHPKEMAKLRYEEFNDEQKAIYQRLVKKK